MSSEHNSKISYPQHLSPSPSQLSTHVHPLFTHSMSHETAETLHFSEETPSNPSSPVKTTSVQSSHLLSPMLLEEDPQAACDIDNLCFQTASVEQKMELQDNPQKEEKQCKCWPQQQPCLSCSNTNHRNGNGNIIKFFEYVIAFKMGIQPSYTPSSSPNLQQTNLSCKEIHRTYLSVPRLSTRSIPDRTASVRAKKYGKAELGSQLDSMVCVHESYCCDLCHAAPIVGSRFHCPQCEDYDECQDCHASSDHEHLMERVDVNGRKRQLQSMVEMLAHQLNRMAGTPSPTVRCLPPNEYSYHSLKE